MKNKIMNFFAPSIYADEEDAVITFIVEEVALEKTNNPQTSVPNILIYSSLAIAPAIGLGVILKKKNVNN